ncbi:hypothetical protein KLEP7_gp120 [Pseudaeromonas phage vB_PpeM_ KLEP7]|nr:hypothetical protein KLEP7_gp120 [Pseudaeromonas phage vB_PpeM_ KLEP7]
MYYQSIDCLVGETIVDIVGLSQYSDEIVFVCESGKRVKMYHEQDCCESVSLEDFNGDISDLIGAVVISAEERTKRGNMDEDDYESVTYTFYDIQTNKGSLWLRWCGSSNGYYSESVNIAVEGENIE